MLREVNISILICCVLIGGCLSNQNLVKGNIQVTSSPTGAEVYLDNGYRGTTPTTLNDVSYGSHTIELRYPGYQSWSTSISVSSSSSQIFTTLSPVSQPNVQSPVSQITTVTLTQKMIEQSTQTAQNKMTITANKDTVISGKSISFSGTCIGCRKIFLLLTGPEQYSNGVIVGSPNIMSDNTWTYTEDTSWTNEKPGSYTMMAFDDPRTTSASVGFRVEGGAVTITANKQSLPLEDSIIFSGTSTSGNNVILTLYGPGQYSNGVVIAQPNVMSDSTWKYTFTTSYSTMQAGSHTMVVSDPQKTTSSNIVFNTRLITVPPTPTQTIQHTYVVALTPVKTNINIRITYYGGPDAAQVSYLHYYLNSVEGIGRPTPAVGDAVVLSGTTGRDHVVVVADFVDGSNQVVLDTYL